MTISDEKLSWLDLPVTRWFPVNLESLLVLLLIALAFLTRFYDLGARTMSHDEVNHVVPAYDYYTGLGYRYDPLSHGPFQFHMMTLSYALFGDNDFTSRIPAAVFSVAIVVVAVFAFRRYLGRLGAMVAGVLFLISPLMLFYGRYARNEVFIVFWGLLTIYAILRYLDRGEKWVLFLFTLVNALHFIDKSTSYIFAAQQLIFLGVYLVDRVTRRSWPRTGHRKVFLILISLAVILLAGTGVVNLQAEKLLEGAAKTITLSLVGGAAAAFIAALAILIIGFGWSNLKSERSFDLVMLLGTLILPLGAAVPVELLGFSALDYSSEGIIRSVIVILIFTALAIALGQLWNRTWYYHAGMFYILIIVLYSSFFTNPEGIAGGFMGALGYWMEQQGVNRGSQPAYYYGLFIIPIYEYLPALGTFLAATIAATARMWQSRPGQPFSRPSDEPDEVPVPTVALIVFWSLTSLIAFTIAGEKMPWLGIHITLPLILVTGWTVGWLAERLKDVHLPNWQVATRVMLLAFLGLLGVITARSAYRAAFLFHDYPFEYLVYAHAAPDPKALLAQIEPISRRLTGGLDMPVGYDNHVRYPYWWYMRHYPNRIDFDVSPSNDVRRAPVIGVTAESYAKLAPILRDDYYESSYMRMWWPNMDYWSLKWDNILVERNFEAGPEAAEMTFGEYLRYAWGHISPVFTDVQTRNAIWQIWLNRDFAPYANLRNTNAFTLTDWGVSDRMTFFFRKDIPNEIWNYSTEALPPVVLVDPYKAITVLVYADQVIGSRGSLPGEFQYPRAIAVANDGSLYVADSLNHRIQHLGQDGQILQIWGSFADAQQGEAPGGTFNEPWGVAVAPDGSVYVADTWNHRIQHFTSDGHFLAMWGYFGLGEVPEAFYGPRSISVDDHGRIYIVDTGNKRVVIFDQAGNYLTQFGSSGFNPGQFEEPVGLAVGYDGSVYVADTWNRRIQVFSSGSSGLYYEVEMQWMVDGWDSQSLDNKPYLGLDDQGNLFATDPEGCRVIVFNPTGQPIQVWDGCFTDAFRMPTGIAIDPGGGFWVTDAEDGRLVHLPPQP
ncbi:MAG: flippase activity-associated protein Agl23 [Chloroflexota bacterium]